jgi:hypothetical protein
MRLITIPPSFYDDHIERDLPAPPIIRQVRGRYEIDADHADAAELLDDARHYASPNGPDCITLGLRMSARATVKAMETTKAS